MSTETRPGITTLLRDHRDWLAGRRLGLVAHHASVDEHGTPSWRLLRDAPACDLRCLFAPEHGFESKAEAGAAVTDARAGGLPVYSLYGATREPTAAMLEDVDAIIFDLQDLGTRCYTYGSTLRLVLESAARLGKTVIVADRPDVLPDTLDGPILEPALSSFVGMIPTPMCYGMTSGELALFLVGQLALDIDLLVAAVAGWARTPGWPDELSWTPPSPGIRTPLAAMTYPAMVLCEALPALDYGRGTELVFQIVGAPGTDSHAVCTHLQGLDLPGVRFQPLEWEIRAGPAAGKRAAGVQVELTDLAAYRPLLTGLALLETFQKHLGIDAVWNQPDTRPLFFDLLAGTRSLRADLQAGRSAREIADGWDAGLAAFRGIREEFLLY